jgi:hypothetical protein
VGGCSDRYSWPDFLQRSKKTKTAVEWLVVAEELAVNNDGKLPSKTWLSQQVGSGIVGSIRNHPEVFAHLPQDREAPAGRPVEEWVSVAEQSAEDNGGKLPPQGWLKKHGYRGLCQAICKYPELFAHLPKEKTFTSVEEWVQIAEGLAANNDGKLPNREWLRKHGYRQIIRVEQEQPEFFAHIQWEESTQKSAKEWVAVSEELAMANGGVLQNSSWLENNGYKNLYQVLRRCRELFAHIPQEVRDTRRNLVSKV